jgi:lipopolysaccharide transport system ATP-binding protein
MEQPSLEEPLITVENVSKKFCRSLKRSLFYGLLDLGREFTGRTRRGTLREREFWAIRDASFEVRRGEIVGLIGPNGSGKSTVLKMLAGLITPDRGRIEVRGRVGAMIQLEAGFSPVLSGRENIAISASILGIPAADLTRRMNEIVEFADIGDFIDAPVRTYSSGMRARLGFAVAIHMDPDILLVDEVLAVGDLNFRSKALEAMLRLTKSGVAVVFVSHNLQHIFRLCNRVLLVNHGETVAYGETDRVISKYMQLVEGVEQQAVYAPGTRDYIDVGDVRFDNASRETGDEIRTWDDVRITLSFEARRNMEQPIFILYLDVEGRQSLGAVISQEMSASRPSFAPGKHTIDVTIPRIALTPGLYSLALSVFDRENVNLLAKIRNLAFVSIEPLRNATDLGVSALVHLPGHWRVE